MTKGSTIIAAAGVAIDTPEASGNSQETHKDHEDALILQTEWVQPDPLGVLELGPDNEFAETDATLTADESVDLAEFSDEQLNYKPSALSWIIPGVAISAIIGWTGFFGFTHADAMLAGAPMAQWTAWTSEWAMPVLLVAVAWLLAMRNSHAEAHRFGKTAAMLSQEARTLEERLTVVNRELSLAREFLGAQSRELDSLGRIAADRLSTHAGALEGLIRDNGAQVDAIASVSDTALANMSKLRDDLPVIANSAKDVSNQVGNTGRTAQEHLSKLVAGLERLNSAGANNEQQVSSFDDRVKATLDHFEAQLTQLSDATDARFAALAERSTNFRDELHASESAALDAMRSRADSLKNDVASMREELSEEEAKVMTALRSQLSSLRESAEAMARGIRDNEASVLEGLGKAKERFFAEMKDVVAQVDALDEQAVSSARERVMALNAEATEFDERLRVRDAHFAQEVSKREEALRAREADALQSLAKRLNELDDSLSARAEIQDKRSQRLARQSEVIASQVSELKELFDSIHGTATSAEEGIAQSLANLKARVLDGEEHISRTGKAMGDLTDASMRLMEIIDASTARTQEDFPKAVGKAVQALQPVEDRAIMLSASMEETMLRAERLSQYVNATKGDLNDAEGAVLGLSQTLGEHSQTMLEQVNSLRETVRALDADGAKLTERTTQELGTAIKGLESSIQGAFSAMESGAHTRLNKVADELSDEAASVIESALSARLDEVLSSIEKRAESATGASKEAAEQLRAQLDEVSSLASTLEVRVAKAREQATEQTGPDFARRMALVTESLNSHAIDITGALSSEVTDTAWSAYLKGDRGIFARRAVKLLDSGQAREIAGLYQNDDDFRAHVNRYIHDFESMLATMLSTPDGNAISVAMLGSDVGKLYVALAQAIERLRS